MANAGFRLPENSYDELTKIIRGYGAVKQEAELAEVSRITAIHRSNISRNGAFLATAGILEGAKKKALTDRGRSLALALEHDIPDQIAQQWRTIVMDSDFFRNLISTLRIRKGMEASSFQAYIAYAAGQTKRQGTMTGAGAVIDILVAAGLVGEEDGKLVAVSDIAWEQDNMDGTVPTDTAFAIPGDAMHTDVPINTITNVPITIQIQVQCGVDDLSSLGSKLRALLAELSTPVVCENSLEVDAIAPAISAA